MLSNFRLFVDRSDTSSLPSELLQFMKIQGLITSVDLKVCFCGLILYSEGIAVFMPRNTDISEIKQPLKAASTLVFALNRYFQERGTEIYSSELGEGSHKGKQLELILSLLEDYSLNGLYSQRITEQTINSGKADWRKTISHSNPFPSKTGPLHLNIYGTRRRNLSDGEVSRIHADVIRELDPFLGWAVTGGGSLLDQGLLRIPGPSGDKEYQIARLERALSSVYSDREIFLVKSLLRYLREQRGDDLSKQVVGLRHFHGMWESMLDKCLKWTLSVNQYLAAPVYKINGTYRSAARKGQRTDTVMKHPEKELLTVVDAKYYGASGLSSAPGWPDLVKQFFYAKALMQLYETAVVGNAFVFPGKQGVIESVHMAERRKRELTEEMLLDDQYPPIMCLYQDPLELLEYYVTGRKLSVLSKALIKS